VKRDTFKQERNVCEMSIYVLRKKHREYEAKEISNLATLKAYQLLLC
jgi:hypothetical protein